ncbi:MAG: hydrolase [Armatimonadetes bacterium]|jgi:ADP-ribose pyrophosphatase YjhB (NUDIX family)|nr:hydrolase [Armatimonadota bacterium]
MYLKGGVLEAVERRFGRPARAEAEAEFTPRSFALLERCARKQRIHDVTLLIRDDAERLALIRKPSYPPEVFRPPSGGVEPGEEFEAGARREALEETGLEVELERYVLRVDARFSCGGQVAPWTTHVLTARMTGGTLAPRDLVEIEEARWATVSEMVYRYRPEMLAMGSAGMRYRVDLQDLALRLLGLADPPAPEMGRLIRELAVDGRSEI